MPVCNDLSYFSQVSDLPNDLVPGCYQCVVQAEEETSQASGELKLGDSPPIFMETFQEGQIFDEGVTISLKCSATATPLPQIRWFLDEQPIDGYAPRRLSMADYVKHSGNVVSFVNITNAKIVDGGEVSVVRILVSCRPSMSVNSLVLKVTILQWMC